jgi:hypothetical protein
MRVGVFYFPSSYSGEHGEPAETLGERGFALPFRFDSYSPLAAA